MFTYYNCRKKRRTYGFSGSKVAEVVELSAPSIFSADTTIDTKNILAGRRVRRPSTRDQTEELESPTDALRQALRDEAELRQLGTMTEVQIQEVIGSQIKPEVLTDAVLSAVEESVRGPGLQFGTPACCCHPLTGTHNCAPGHVGDSGIKSQAIAEEGLAV